MKRIALLFWFIVAGGLAVSAQPSLPGKCDVFYPELLYSTPVLSEAQALEFERSGDYGQAKKPKNMTFWVVYSDRDDNITYTSSAGSTKFSSLSFSEKLRIAQIRDGRALVYTEPQEGIEYPLISQDAVCKGWVPMKNLLLWHYSLADEVGIYQKALLCVNLAEEGSDLGNMYFNPKKTGHFKKIRTDMRFYFVMKREGGLSLLASTHSMDGTSDKVLEGWVPVESYVAWNQRSCLEPTWNHKDVEYFADKSITLRVCSAEDLDEVVRRIEFKAQQSTGRYDPHMYRMHPDELRFPILDYDGPDNIYNCSSFGTPGGSPSVVEASTETASSGTPLGYTNQQLNELLNINIGIVIDGTSSMEKFYPAVQEAIKKAGNYFSSKHNIKVGVVIYRDYSDGEEYVTEVCRLTDPKNPQLHSFLTSGGKYGIKSSPRDKSLEEAMYYGINTALDKLGFKPDQSNLLLVVGDCGNDPADNKVSMQTIVDKLVEKNVNIMGFQVRTGAENAFGQFTNQMTRIMVQSLEKKFSSLANSQVSVDIADTDDGFQLVNDMKSNLYIASHSYPVYGGSMQAEKLTKLMENAVKQCSESVQYQIDLITILIHNGFDPSPGITGVDLNEQYLIKRLGEEVYNKVKKSNSLISFEGYALKKHEDSGRAFFKPVVFISSDELNTLIMRLAPVNNAAVAASNDREPYVNAMKALIQSMDPSITDERMNQMRQDEIMAMVAGLNEAATALKGPTMLEIANPQAVSHSEYVALVATFQKKFKNLERIKRTEYKYTRMFNGLKYYWIPVEDLP